MKSGGIIWRALGFQQLRNISAVAVLEFFTAQPPIYMGVFGFGNVEEEMILLGFMMDYCLGMSLLFMKENRIKFCERV